MVYRVSMRGNNWAEYSTSVEACWFTTTHIQTMHMTNVLFFVVTQSCFAVESQCDLIAHFQNNAYLLWIISQEKTLMYPNGFWSISLTSISHQPGATFTQLSVCLVLSTLGDQSQTLVGGRTLLSYTVLIVWFKKLSCITDMFSVSDRIRFYLLYQTNNNSH